MRLADAWLRATRSLGFALTSREMAAEWPRFGEGPQPSPLSNTVQNLAKNGTLHCVSERVGRRRYLHRDHPEAAVEPPVDGTFEAQVLEALRLAATQAQRYVTTREVTAAMLEHRLVASLSLAEKTRLQQILHTLSHAVQPRDPASPVVPAPVTRASTTRITARESKRAYVYWWRPTALVFAAPAPDTPGTPREAATRVVETVRALLGRPATYDDLALYVAAHRALTPDDPILAALGTRGLGPAVQKARGWIDRSTAKGRAGLTDSGLVRLRTPFTAGRLLPSRVALPPINAEEVARATASDALLRLQPGREVDLLGALAALPGATDPVLRDLVALRRQLMQQALEEILPREAWPEMILHLRHALTTMDGWVLALGGPAFWRSGPMRRAKLALSVREQDVRALDVIMAWTPPTMPSELGDLTPIFRIGDHATLAIGDLAPIGAAIDAVQGAANGRVVHQAFIRARRVPPPAYAPTTRATPLSIAVSSEHLDRVDALTVAIEVVGVPVASTLVSDAVLLLGPVLRDPRVIARFLAVLPRQHGWARRGLLVALGMLGERPDPELWIPTPDDAAAGIFATVVAAPTDAARYLRKIAAAGFPTSSRRLVQHALTQIDAGEWLAAVD